MNRKSLWTILAIVIGAALSYIPNNYMSKKYEYIAFFIVVGIAIIAALWSYILKKKKEANQ